jgi:catechol 2,3-dioxygenase-like lactoylglutathione lyase family enzyme
MARVWRLAFNLAVNKLKCTHIVLYVKDIEVTRHFYNDVLGCVLRRFSHDEKILSVAVGTFIINFYLMTDSFSEGHTRGIAHLGFEVETRATVDAYAEQFQFSDGFRDKRNAIQGPYRFYVNDPDGYTIEIYTWDGIEEGT